MGADRVDSNPEREDPGQQPGGRQSPRRTASNPRAATTVLYGARALRYKACSACWRRQLNRIGDSEKVIYTLKLDVEAT